jgi:hypothetical protein
VAFRRHVDGSNSVLAAAAERVRQGQLDASGLAELLTGVLTTCSSQVMVLKPAAVVASEAPWFDERCRQCCGEFRDRWAALLAQGGGGSSRC